MIPQRFGSTEPKTEAGSRKRGLTGGVAGGRVQLVWSRLGRRTVRIGSARGVLPEGLTVKAKVKVSNAARRAAGRGGLRAVATLAVRGVAPARAAVRLSPPGRTA